MSTFQTKTEQIFWWAAVGFGVALIASFFYIISLERKIQNNAKSCECKCFQAGYEAAFDDLEVVTQSPLMEMLKKN